MQILQSVMDDKLSQLTTSHLPHNTNEYIGNQMEIIKPRHYIYTQNNLSSATLGYPVAGTQTLEYFI